MSSWSEDKTLLLIEKIKASNVWDVKSKEYKDTNKRNDIFEEIGKSFKCSRKEVEDKWHNIKSQFSRELAKIKSSYKSGRNTDDIYEPSWYTFNTLMFLKDHYKPLHSKSTDSEEIDASQVQTQAISMSDFQSQNETFNKNDQLNEDNDSENIPTDAPIPPRRNTAKKRRDDTTDMQEVVNCMKIVGQNMIKKSRDAFDIFGEHVANELRLLRDSKYTFILAQVKQKIYKVFSEAEMDRIQLDSNDSRPTTANSISSNSSTPLVNINASTEYASDTSSSTCTMIEDNQISNETILTNYVSTFSDYNIDNY